MYAEPHREERAQLRLPAALYFRGSGRPFAFGLRLPIIAVRVVNGCG
jgi:hypothetical protein